MDNSVDLTALLPEVEQPNLGGMITVNQVAFLSGLGAIVGLALLLVVGLGRMDFFVTPAKGSVMDYRPAPIAGNLGYIVSPAEAKIKFLKAYPEWREVAR